jgi:hypothetical protein
MELEVETSSAVPGSARLAFAVQHRQGMDFMIQVLHIGFFTNFGTGNARVPLQNLGNESLTSV